METNPAPDSPEHALIERIEQLSFKLLETPDSEQVMMCRRAPFGDRHNMELRATTSHAMDEDDLFYDRDDSRYVYLGKNGQCRPIMSVDLNDLRRSDPPREPLHDRLDVLYALANAETQGVDSQHKELAWIVHGLARAIGESRPIEQRALQKAEELFVLLMDDSMTATNRTYNYHFATGQLLSIASVVNEGNLAHARPWMLEDELYLSVCVEDGDRRVMFEKMQNGKCETYTEVGDPAEILAALVDPENVDRDEDGEILGIMHTGSEYPAARAAERAAMNLPRVRLKHLQVVEMAVGKVQK